MPWAVAGVLAAALIAVVVFWKFAAPARRAFPVLSYIPPPPGTTFREFGFGAGPVVVSPDGKQLAFSATDQNGVTRLYVRPLASGKAQAIAGTEDAAYPFWSPDSRSLGFFANQKLKTVNLDNGSIQVLADALCEDESGAWSPNGTILYSPRCAGPIYEISSLGRRPSPATKLRSGESGDGVSAFLPDGSHFLYVSFPVSVGATSIWMGSLDSNKRKLVLQGASQPEFASGRLLFIRDNRIFAQPFDPATGSLSGEAEVLAEAQNYSVSSAGVLAYQGGTREGRLEWFDRSGNPLGSVGTAAQYLEARISPDGTRILANVIDPQTGSIDLWSYPALGGPRTRLTFGPGDEVSCAWSPDGKYIAYACQPDGKLGICRKRADGSGTEERLITLAVGAAIAYVADWSPDGRYISFAESASRASRGRVWLLPLSGGGKPFQPAAVNASQFEGVFSPDGRWLAYFSDETGRPEVFAVPFPGPGGKFQISQNGGWLERWDKKGHLYFLTMGNRLMEADLATTGQSLQVKALHPLFQVSLPRFEAPFFDVTADGSRFIVVTSTDPNAAQSIGLLLDWQSKLKGKQ